MRIESREQFWKNRNYATIYKSRTVEILRPTEKSLDDLIRNVFRKKKKWE